MINWKNKVLAVNRFGFCQRVSFKFSLLCIRKLTNIPSRIYEYTGNTSAQVHAYRIEIFFRDSPKNASEVTFRHSLGNFDSQVRILK